MEMPLNLGKNALGDPVGPDREPHFATVKKERGCSRHLPPEMGGEIEQKSDGERDLVHSACVSR